MLQLVQPIWLAALAAIGIPILLHLWNDRPGKMLSVGSVALLEKQSPRRAWTRRLSDWWLLLLRCCLLAILALLLCGPFWNSPHAKGPRGWILSETWVSNGSGGSTVPYQAMMDSLQKAGYERPFPPRVKFGWDDFRSADRAAPEGLPFFVFTSGRAVSFRGARPSSHRPVHWYTYAPADSLQHWTADSWPSARDSLRVVEGTSRATGTSFRFQTVAGGQPDSGSIQVAIVADPAFAQDGQYLAAAIGALGQYADRRIRLTVSDQAPGYSTDWLFWLSSKPLPSTNPAKKIIRYEFGRPVAVDSWWQGDEEIRVGKEISATAETNPPESVWKDGFGHPLLSRTDSGSRQVYRFFSRFDPNWNDLVWSRRFPAMIGRLLWGSDALESWSGRDRRVLDPDQITPASTVAAGEAVAAKRAGFDLSPACWLLLLLLFVIERLVSYRTDQIRNYELLDGKK